MGRDHCVEGEGGGAGGVALQHGAGFEGDPGGDQPGENPDVALDRRGRTFHSHAGDHVDPAGDGGEVNGERGKKEEEKNKKHETKT